MEKEVIILQWSTTCDLCEKTIEAGESVYPLYDSNWDRPNVPMEHIYSNWIMDSCEQCICHVDTQSPE